MEALEACKEAPMEGSWLDYSVNATALKVRGWWEIPIIRVGPSHISPAAPLASLNEVANPCVLSSCLGRPC